MLISIVSFLTVFTIVVLIHELCHFLAARRAYWCTTSIEGPS